MTAIKKAANSTTLTFGGALHAVQIMSRVISSPAALVKPGKYWRLARENTGLYLAACVRNKGVSSSGNLDEVRILRGVFIASGTSVL